MVSYVNPISFTAPNSAPPQAPQPPAMPRSRSELMAYLLERNAPGTPDYSSVQSPIEGVAKMLTSGLQGYMGKKALQGEEDKKLANANTFADLLMGPTADGSPDPRRDQLVQYLMAGGDAGAVSGKIATNLGLGDPPEPKAYKPGEVIGYPTGDTFKEIYRVPESPEPVKPYSNAGEIKADFDAGFLTQEEMQAALANLGKSGTTVNVGAGEKAWDVESAKLFAKRYDDIATQAQSANEMLGLYDLAETGLETGVRTGVLGSEEQAVRRLGQMLGVGDADKIAGGELLTAVQNRMALLMRSPDSGMGMPGAVSDRDLMFLKEAQIGLDRSPEGNRKMLETFRRLEHRKIEIATLADQYVQENGQLDPGFYEQVRQYAEANPLFDDIAGGPDVSGASADGMDEFETEALRRGWIKSPDGTWARP